MSQVRQRVGGQAHYSRGFPLTDYRKIGNSGLQSRTTEFISQKSLNFLKEHL